MSVSVVQTLEVSSDLQERLQPKTDDINGPGLRKRGERFAFMWPFVSKDMDSQNSVSSTDGRTSGYSGPQSLSERCGQLLRQFPAYFSTRAFTSTNSSAIRDTIERSLTEAKAAWLVVAVYFALALLTVLSVAIGVALVGASKPAGLWFLIMCVAATGGIACTIMRTQAASC